MATAHTPHAESEGLIVEAHVATAEEPEPREGGIVGVGSRRPVASRLHIIAKGMARGEIRIPT